MISTWTPGTASTRLRSVDLLRGLACALMAIDHVRVYAAVPAGGVQAGVFFTRWITHFVAPAFCFFAGTGIYFLARKLADPRKLTRFLLSRGVLLVVLELTVIRVCWTFNVAFMEFNLAGVIWMLGICMMLMAPLVRLPARIVGIIGVMIMALQNLLGTVGNALPASTPAPIRWLFQLLYLGDGFSLGEHGPPLMILYVIVPWIGVMAAGYGFGIILHLHEHDRRKWCYRIGIGATAAFVLIAGATTLLSTPGADAPPVFIRILGQRKYPASQLFLLMTLGPIIALIPAAERARGWLADALVTFGSVPMFYYLLHIPLIHLSAMLVSVVRTGGVTPWLVGNFPMLPGEAPPGYRWSLGLLYVVWAILLPVLYAACRWYASIKSRRQYRLLTYL